MLVKWLAAATGRTHTPSIHIADTRVRNMSRKVWYSVCTTDVSSRGCKSPRSVSLTAMHVNALYVRYSPELAG